MKTMREALDRIEELEGILGLRYRLPNKLNLTETQHRVVGILLSRQIIDKDSLFSLLYGHLPEKEQPTERKVVEVHMSGVRKKLAKHGYKVLCDWGVGYYLEDGAREELRKIIRVDAERKIKNAETIIQRLALTNTVAA